jgi:hypothetical protein
MTMGWTENFRERPSFSMTMSWKTERSGTTETVRKKVSAYDFVPTIYKKPRSFGRLEMWKTHIIIKEDTQSVSFAGSS